MSQIKTGHFEPDGAIIYLPIGFVPDFFFLAEMGATNPILYYWWERQEDDEASGSQEGIIDTAGTKTKAADAGGITAYDTAAQEPTIAEWAASTAYTARSATASGSFVKCTTSGTDKNGYSCDREAIFECVTAGTSGTTEPTWPSDLDDNSASDNGVVWQKVNEAIVRGGYAGVTIAAALMTNAQEMYYLAIQADRSVDLGDVDGWPSGVAPASTAMKA